MNAENESLNEFVFASDLFKKVKEAKNQEDAVFDKGYDTSL